MRRRSVYLTLGFGLFLATVAGALALLARYERAWYRRAAVPPSEERQKGSQEFYAEFFHLWSVVGVDREWDGVFTDTQINSFFEEDFIRSGWAAKLLPDNIRHIRMSFEKDRMRVGFRYGRGAWSAVVSLELRMWIAANEPNVLALELVGFHVGALPLALQSTLKPIADAAKENGIDVAWYRHPDTGNPVAVLRFQADQPRPTMQLRAVQLSPGKFTILGRSSEGPHSEAPAAPRPEPGR
jgi:hypothetical protein